MSDFRHIIIAVGLAAALSGECLGAYGDFGSAVTDINTGAVASDVADDVAPAISVKPIYCDGLLNLSSPRRQEAFQFKYRDGFGAYDEALLSSLNWFLRCGDGTWQFMDVKVVELLNYISKLLRDPVIDILSGYRSPAYNKKLAVTNENVARNSLHMYGKAIDFRVPGMGTRDLCSYALLARNTLGYGGVGCYQSAGFVHIDSGSVRQWAKK